MDMIIVYENVQELRKMLEGCGSLNSKINRLVLEGVELEKYLRALNVVEIHLRARIEEASRIREGLVPDEVGELEGGKLAPDYETSVADSVL